MRVEVDGLRGFRVCKRILSKATSRYPKRDLLYVTKRAGDGWKWGEKKPGIGFSVALATLFGRPAAV